MWNLLNKFKGWVVLGYFAIFEVVYWVTKIRWNDAISDMETSSEVMSLLEIVGVAVSNVNALSIFVFIYIIGRVGK